MWLSSVCSLQEVVSEQGWSAGPQVYTYRGIALLRTPSKVFSKVILNCLKPHAELLRASQSGFRWGRGCADQLFTLRVLMDKVHDYHQPLWVLY